MCRCEDGFTYIFWQPFWPQVYWYNTKPNDRTLTVVLPLETHPTPKTGDNWTLPAKMNRFIYHSFDLLYPFIQLEKGTMSALVVHLFRC